MFGRTAIFFSGTKWILFFMYKDLLANDKLNRVCLLMLLL